MSRVPFARLDADIEELIAQLEAALRQCRRSHRAAEELIGDRIPDYTDPDWVVSVPGSGHGGLGSRNPFDSVPGGGFWDEHPLNPRGED